MLKNVLDALIYGFKRDFGDFEWIMIWIFMYFIPRPLCDEFEDDKGF